MPTAYLTAEHEDDDAARDREAEQDSDTCRVVRGLSARPFAALRQALQHPAGREA
jgi:hypothetical protein